MLQTREFPIRFFWNGKIIWKDTAFQMKLWEERDSGSFPERKALGKNFLLKFLPKFRQRVQSSFSKNAKKKLKGNLNLE